MLMRRSASSLRLLALALAALAAGAAGGGRDADPASVIAQLAPLGPSRPGRARARAPARPRPGPARNARGAQLSVLQNARPEDVHLEPYPHVVIPNALPRGLYSRLSAEFPRDAAFGRAPPNTRVDLRASAIIGGSAKVLPLWRRFVEYHVSSAFYKQVHALFAQGIRNHRPDVLAFARFRGRKDTSAMRAFFRGQEQLTGKKPDGDVKLDCQIGINTAVKGKVPTSVRGPHTDAKSEVYAGLLYLRQRADKTSTGGELQVLGRLPNATRLPNDSKLKAALGLSTKRNHEQFDPSTLKLYDQVQYGANVAVFFVNSPLAVHSVTPRSPTPMSRRLVNFIAELPSTAYCVGDEECSADEIDGASGCRLPPKFCRKSSSRPRPAPPEACRGAPGGEHAAEDAAVSV